MIASDDAVASLVVVPHRVVDVCLEIVIAECIGHSDRLSDSAWSPIIFRIHVVVADRVNHRNFRRLEYILVESLEILRHRHFRLLNKVSRHKDTINAISIILGGLGLELVEGCGELIGIGIARPLDVHVADGGEGKGYLGLVKYGRELTWSLDLSGVVNLAWLSLKCLVGGDPADDVVGGIAGHDCVAAVQEKVRAETDMVGAGSVDIFPDGNCAFKVW